MVIIKDIDILNDEDMLDSISDISFRTFGFGILFCGVFAIFVPHETFPDGWCLLRWLIGIGAGLILTLIFHNVLYVCTSVCCSRYGVSDAGDGSACEVSAGVRDLPTFEKEESEGLSVDVQDICFTKHTFVRIMMIPTWVLTCALAALAFVDYAPLGTCIVGMLHLLGCAIDWAIVRAIRSNKRVKYVADTELGIRLYAEDDDMDTPTGQYVADETCVHIADGDRSSSPKDDGDTEVYSGGDETV